ASAPPPPRPVKCVTVAPAAVTAPLLTGDIRAHDETTLSFRLEGRILTRSAEPGARFRRGDTLATLDSPLALSQMTRAQADLDSSRAAEKVAALTLHRMRLLMPSGAVARAQLDTTAADWQAALSRLQSSEAALKNAQENLRWRALTAPDDGIVIGVSASAGQVISAGEAVYSVAFGSRRDVVFDVAAPDSVSRRPGAVFQVALLRNPAVVTTGHLRDVSPQADAQTRSWRVRVTLDNPPSDMVLGASATIALPAGEGEPLIRLPAAALTRLAGEPAVFVLDPLRSLVRRRAVRIAGYASESVLIRAGVAPGERVVTAGVRTLRDGERVTQTEGISL
ncbi:efflux RND transporter periplasmic adaptor subunit, partial [Pantoea septica]|uniref:efflux RND transporter periplasmic adaptor subunit n=1 Tax=Pantoea septica TaxID=472695 RepID=UPI0028AA0954